MNGNDLRDSQTGERLYLNKEERALFKQVIQSMKPDARTFCSMLYYTGCRLNEAIGVTPNRLFFDERKVRLPTLKQGEGNPNPNRMVELPAEYLYTLESEYRARSRKGKKTGNKPIWDFVGRTGYKYVKQAMQEAEITGKKATPRGLRHSMGVMLAMNKVPVNVIANILGHRYLSNTMIYMQVVDEERREMISNVW